MKVRSLELSYEIHAQLNDPAEFTNFCLVFSKIMTFSEKVY
jgi:hypothetical protein